MGRHKGVRVETCQIDLSNMDEESRRKYSEAIAGKDIGVLVNNAGLSYEFVTYFEEVSPKRIDDMLSVNNVAPTVLTHLTLPHFLKKKKGAV